MKKLVLSLFAVLACGGALRGQNDIATEFSFVYRLAGTAPQLGVSPGGTIVFPGTNVGKSDAATLLITSASNVTSDYAIGNVAVAGSGFAVTASPTVPQRGGGSGTITITFAPTASGPVNGSLQFTLTSPTAQQFTFVFSLFGNALAPSIVTSYIAPATGNQIQLHSGDTIPFPKAPVGTSTSTTFDLSNGGTGSGTVDSVSLSGDAFSLTNLSLTPAILTAGGDFRFQIAFTPLAAQTYSGSLQISIGGIVSTFGLLGQGTNASLTYNILTASGTQPLSPGATITLPDTPADGTSTSTITAQVTNNGNQDTAVAAINVTGADFQLTNLPILPVTLKANGGTALFNIVYEPKAAGPSTGRLQIGNDLFLLAGNGLGALLTFTADVGTGSIPLVNKGTIAVPNTIVGAKRAVSVAVTNSGNQSATVSSFSVSGTAFSVPNPPALPVTLAPGQTQTLQFTFAPTATGQATGTLAINDQTFTLIAAGDTPQALPQVTITGVQNTTAPLQQPAVGIQLASAYPSDLTGVLTLSFIPDSFVDDPAIEFAIGTRTLNFTIPANTTQAVFGQLGKSAPFQTGTLSGTITFSATFSVGSVDITPAAAPAKTTVIPQGPPQLRSVRLGTQTANTIQLLISGYSTTRTLSQLTFQFTGATGTNVQTTSLTTDVSSAFTSWYSNPASQVFGSQFTVSLTLTITGDATALQTISVTAANAQGTSQAVSLTLR